MKYISVLLLIALMMIGILHEVHSFPVETGVNSIQDIIRVSDVHVSAEKMSDDEYDTARFLSLTVILQSSLEAVVSLQPNIILTFQNNITEQDTHSFQLSKVMQVSDMYLEQGSNRFIFPIGVFQFEIGISRLQHLELEFTGQGFFPSQGVLVPVFITYLTSEKLDLIIHVESPNGGIVASPISITDVWVTPETWTTTGFLNLNVSIHSYPGQYYTFMVMLLDRDQKQVMTGTQTILTRQRYEYTIHIPFSANNILERWDGEYTLFTQISINTQVITINKTLVFTGQPVFDPNEFNLTYQGYTLFNTSQGSFIQFMYKVHASMDVFLEGSLHQQEIFFQGISLHVFPGDHELVLNTPIQKYSMIPSNPTAKNTVVFEGEVQPIPFLKEKAFKQTIGINSSIYDHAENINMDQPVTLNIGHWNASTSNLDDDPEQEVVRFTIELNVTAWADTFIINFYQENTNKFSMLMIYPVKPKHVTRFNVTIPAEQIQSLFTDTSNKTLHVSVETDGIEYTTPQTITINMALETSIYLDQAIPLKKQDYALIDTNNDGVYEFIRFRYEIMTCDPIAVQKFMSTVSTVTYVRNTTLLPGLHDYLVFYVPTFMITQKDNPQLSWRINGFQDFTGLTFRLSQTILSQPVQTTAITLIPKATSFIRIPGQEQKLQGLIMNMTMINEFHATLTLQAQDHALETGEARLQVLEQDKIITTSTVGFLNGNSWIQVPNNQKTSTTRAVLLNYTGIITPEDKFLYMWNVIARLTHYQYDYAFGFQGNVILSFPMQLETEVPNPFNNTVTFQSMLNTTIYTNNTILYTTISETNKLYVSSLPVMIIVALLIIFHHHGTRKFTRN